MSLTYGFYNSVNHDRKYDAEQISSIFDGVIKDGVFQSIGTALMVEVGTGMTVDVGIGRAWFNHTWTNNDSKIPLIISQSEMILNRIDTVIIEVNLWSDVRANSIKVIKGTPASSPVKPTLVHNDLVNQYPLAYIYVGANVTSIVQANITNCVGTSECPFVTGVVQSISTDSLLAQWNSQFNIWFDAMKGQLTTDAAGNLQSQITGIDTILSVFSGCGVGTNSLRSITNPLDLSLITGIYFLDHSTSGVTNLPPNWTKGFIYVQANSTYRKVIAYAINSNVSDLSKTLFYVNDYSEMPLSGNTIGWNGWYIPFVEGLKLGSTSISKDSNGIATIDSAVQFKLLWGGFLTTGIVTLVDSVFAYKILYIITDSPANEYNGRRITAQLVDALGFGIVIGTSFPIFANDNGDASIGYGIFNTETTFNYNPASSLGRIRAIYGIK